MEGFYHIYALLAPQCVKLITKLLYIITTLKIKSYIHVHTHAGGKHVDHGFTVSFVCTDLQSVNAKYFEKPFSNYSTIIHTVL